MRNFMRSSGIVTFLSFILACGATEAGVRTVKTWLPVHPGKWPRIEIASKLHQLDKEIRRGERPEVIFVGSSVMAGGVDPVQFSDAADVTSYNAAWAGATGRTSAMWTVDVLEPLADPELVVLGIQTGEVNDNGPKNQITYRKFLKSPGYKQTTSNLARALEGWLGRFSALMRNRLAFRTPTVLFKEDRAALREAEVRKEIGAQGRRVEEPVTYRFHENFRTGFHEKNLADLSYGGPEYRAIVRMHDRLAERGVQMVVMVTAVTDDYYSVHADPEGDKAAFERLVDRFQRETGATVIHAADAFSTSAPFRDPVHLDLEGRRAMSVALGESWRDISGSKGARFTVSCGGPDEAPVCRVTRDRREISSGT